jgi:regulation of enolase protein 1 (concanavalin A-like superfamily)
MASTDRFTLHAPPATDVWRKPPSTDRFNATTKLQDAIPLTTFHRAQISFSSKWVHRYDQGGLLLHLTKAGAKDKWLKTGVEFYNERQFVSTVGCDNFADWSIYPATGNEFTVEVRREGDENGKGLWVYWLRLGEDGEVVERVPLREVAWFFAQEEEWSVQIGAYACRPAGHDLAENEELSVTFWGLQSE